MTDWLPWPFISMGRYIELQNKHLALLDKHSVLQDKHRALQDRHEALLDSHIEALTELLEGKQTGAPSVADGTATVARLKSGASD